MSSTIAVKDCLGIYASANRRLKEFFVKFGKEFCLPRICGFLTKHFVHVSHILFCWQGLELHLRIINFCAMPSHKGKEIRQAIELCLFWLGHCEIMYSKTLFGCKNWKWSLQKYGIGPAQFQIRCLVAPRYCKRKLVSNSVWKSNKLTSNRILDP